MTKSAPPRKLSALRGCIHPLERLEASIGKEREQLGDAQLDEVNAGGFQRLDEARRQTRATTFRFHASLRRPVTKLRWRGGARAWAADCPSKSAPLSGLHERAGEYEAIADAMLQRNPPLPSCKACCRPRVGLGQPGARTRYRNGAVTRQPVLPILITARRACSMSRPRNPDSQ